MELKKRKCIKFLVWMMEQSTNQCITMSFREMSRQYGVSHVTILNYIKSLGLLGLIEIEDIGGKRNIIHLNMEKLNVALNERG